MGSVVSEIEDEYRQYNIGEQRAGAEFKLGRLLVEDRRASHVTRQEIGRALNSLEFATDAQCQRSSQNGFGDAGNVFQQKMAFAEPANQ